jgi:anti-sigma regulatory factor (Ser/Thr protein kinase)
MPQPTDDPDVVLEFGHDAGASRTARHAIAPLFDDEDDVIRDDATTSASEMVTNVVTHTDDGGIMRVWDPKPDVPMRIEVEDTDARALSPRIEPTADQVGGRGLYIVDRLADAWGSFRTAAGKVVWAEFDRLKRRREAVRHEE